MLPNIPLRIVPTPIHRRAWRAIYPRLYTAYTAPQLIMATPWCILGPTWTRCPTLPCLLRHNMAISAPGCRGWCWTHYLTKIITSIEIQAMLTGTWLQTLLRGITARGAYYFVRCTLVFPDVCLTGNVYAQECSAHAEIAGTINSCRIRPNLPGSQQLLIWIATLLSSWSPRHLGLTGIRHWMGIPTYHNMGFDAWANFIGPWNTTKSLILSDFFSPLDLYSTFYAWEHIAT